MKANLYTKPRSIVLMLLFLAFAFHSNSQQVTRNVTASNGTYIGFYEFRPYNYNANPTRKYPLIIFLHGIGERGNGTTELPRVLTWAIPNYCANGATMTFNVNGQEESFLTLSPQLSLSWGNWQPFYVEEMIKWAKQTLRVDTNRIYLTGLSLGGGGVWKYATSSAAAAKSLAAIAPVCGTCDYTNFCNIAQNRVGVWAFHAQDDGTVGVGCTFNAINQINACSPIVKPRQSIYPDGGHFIWNRSFDTTHNIHTPNMYEWLLSHNRSLPPPPNALPIADAGPDKSIGLPISSTTLTGLASSDPDGAIASYYWEQIAGPNWTPLSSNQTATITVNSLNQQGVYTYKMTVTDIAGATDIDTVSINVFPPGGYNAPPIANAGPDQTITTNSAVLNSYGTYDTDGTITSYTWSKVSGPAQGSVTNQNYAVANAGSMVSGVYKFRLFVTDNLGGVDDDTVQITVNLPGPANQPPVANAGADITITLPTNSTTLNGTGSTDADGTINNYTWTKIAGPSSYTISNTFAASTAIGSLAQGTYSFRLVVTDNNGATDDDTVNVIVNAAPPPPPPANQPPVANAGADITITLPTSSTTLNGSGSTDADGTINNYAWTKIAGPATYTIANTATASTGLSNLVQGTYSFRLVVTDNTGATDDDTVNVIVNAAPPPPPPPPANQPPVANAGADITITLPTSSTTLNGSGSTDADGTINNYAWTKISGPATYTIANAATASTGLSNLVQGTYSFRLVVIDNNGATDDDTVNVIVNAAPPPPPPANQPPVANAGADITITLPTNSTTLNGTGSTDADGTINNYTWTKIAGPSSYTISNTFAASTAIGSLVQGTYSFRLVVTDNNGATDDDTVNVIVNAAPPPPPPPANQPPVANAGADITITLPTSSTTLNGSGSTDADGTINNYAWTKIAGPATYTIANTATASTGLSNLVQGTYSFRLVVTDNNGATDDDTVNVIVNAAPPPPPPANQPPVANAGADITITLPTSSTTLNGSGSTDADGTINNYAWTKIAGPATYSIANTSASTTGISNLIEGVYTFRLSVTDNAGATATDDVTVTVLAQPNTGPVANAGNDIEITLPVNRVNLDGSASTDSDGSITSFNWIRVSGPGAVTIVNSNTSSPSVDGLSQGLYEFELTVTDDRGATAKDRVLVKVNRKPNAKPLAKANKDTSVALTSAKATLNGAESVDTDGTIVTYKWTQVSGPAIAAVVAPTAVETEVLNLQEGVYEFELAVTDNEGDIATATVKVSVINAFRYSKLFKIYPNPAREAIQMQLIDDAQGRCRIFIYDVRGKTVLEKEFSKDQSMLTKTIDVSKLKPGMYYLQVVESDGSRIMRQFVKH